MIDKIKQGLREYGLTTFAVDNRTSIFLLTFMISLFGVMSYNDMPKEAYPEIAIPTIFINTVYPGNSAKDIENLVTRPIEKELASISEIKKLNSSSAQDFSIIIAEFDSDVDSEFALRKAKDAVDKAKGDLPNDLPSEPDVSDFNFSEFPVMTVNISGDYPNHQLRNFAEYLQDKIEDLKEIKAVNIKGALEREVKIEVDLPRMEAMQVSFMDIENAVRSENMNMSGGEILTNGFRRSIRVLGEFKSAKELENMIVKNEHNAPIFLRDIATVSFGDKEKTSIARADNLPVISLDIIKRSGENLLDASDKIKIEVEKAKKDVFPKDIKVTTFNDMSVQTRDMVSNLENSIISGVILVVLILLFFLGLRNALFVGLAIPLSMLMGIMIMGMMGYTMNMVVLFSLILALGMLVDNAIVVVENIYNYMQEGYSGIDAAKYATGEVALPIIASTATTLAAFVPLAFWPGIMGSFMKFLPITLIIVLSSSLFVALVINPVLTSVFMKIDEESDDVKVKSRRTRNVLIGVVIMFLIAAAGHFSQTMWVRNLFSIVAVITLLNYFILRPVSAVFQEKALPWLENSYNWFIIKVLHRYVPIGVFLGTIVLLVFTFGLLGKNMPDVELFPTADPLYVNAFVELPMGKDIEVTNEVLKELEAKVGAAMEKYQPIIEATLVQIGENTSDPNAGPSFGNSPHKARLTVSFVPSKDRGELSSVDAMDDMRKAVKGIPGVEIVVDREQSGPPQGKAIDIQLRGEDVDTLALLSENIIAFIKSKNIQGIEELKPSVKIGKPEMEIHIDREAARTYQISTYNIADAIRTSVFGKEISKFKEGEEEYPINLRLAEKYRYDKENLINQKITFRNPANGRIAQVPISTVASVKYTSSYNLINRKDQERIIGITSNVLEDFNADVVVKDIKSVLEDYPMPKGYTYSFGGQQEEMAEQMAFLSKAFMLALFAIFLILVAQFNSIISPFIIILSVVFSTIGVFLGYVYSEMNIVIVMTGVGVISLAGIVVNNAIVLVDYINLVIKRKQNSLGFTKMSELTTAQVKAAIVESGGRRLRPVLLTAITTVLGLIPLAIGLNINFTTLITDLDPQYYTGGDNAAFWGTMAWTVIYGLVFATFLTLVVVPVMYWLAYRAMRLISKYG
ncbi:MAG TPA: efflux RND transporter permease subunit [Phaeodactylibacter sp.]|nr:efflux RND transporter permease subunit [Phaeodactylibacter sp.]